MKKHPHPIVFILFLIFMYLPTSALAQAVDPAAVTLEEPSYVTGRVSEILSETQVQDEAFGRNDTRLRFQVQVEGQEEPIELEQTLTPDTPAELWPQPGKRFVFYRETMADGSRSYTLIDVQRLNHVPWLLGAVVLALILLGRWYGIKTLLICGTLVMVMFLLQLIRAPWLVKSLMGFLSIVFVAPLLTFGVGKRFFASVVASVVGALAIFVLVWLGGLFSISSPSALFQSSMILQMSAGLSYIAISTLTAQHHAQRTQPEIGLRALFQKGVVGGRGSIEMVATLYLILGLAQAFHSVSLPGQVVVPGQEAGLLQIEPILTELVSYLFMLIGFALVQPLSALIGARSLSQSTPPPRRPPRAA